MAREIMKVNSKIYKGIEYVQLEELPEDQKEKLSESLNSENFIKILVGEKILVKCIQYKDYELWFDNVFKQQTVVLTKENLSEGQPVEMVLGKA